MARPANSRQSETQEHSSLEGWSRSDPSSSERDPVTSSMLHPARVRPSTTPDGRTGFHLSSGTYRRRPWQIGLGVALVVLCGAVGATVFHRRPSGIGVIAARNSRPNGATAADLATGSLPANDNITGHDAERGQRADRQELAVPTTQGQFAGASHGLLPAPLAAGSQVVGVLLKGDQIPSVTDRRRRSGPVIGSCHGAPPAKHPLAARQWALAGGLRPPVLATGAPRPNQPVCGEPSRWRYLATTCARGGRLCRRRTRSPFTSTSGHAP